jgi:hypothetical protein
MACLSTTGPAAMDFSAFLPPKAAQEAAALARRVDAATSGIAARRAAARESQLAAERDCVLAWALAEAGRGGGA